jgi:hypothetical protein
MHLDKFLLSLSLTLAAAIAAWAAEPASPTRKGLEFLTEAAAQSDEPVIPERELKFDVAEDETPLPLQEVHEGMLDQRYVATFRLMFVKRQGFEEEPAGPPPGGAVAGPGPAGARGLGGPAGAPASRPEIPFFPNTTGLAVDDFVSALGSRGPSPAYAFLDQSSPPRIQGVFFWQHTFLSFGFMSNFMPCPRQDLLDELVSKTLGAEHPKARQIRTAFEKRNTLFVRSSLPDHRGKKAVVIEIQLLATSIDDAKNVVAAWSNIYDWGICYPGLKQCIDMRKRFVRGAEETVAKLKDCETKLADATQDIETYKEFADISHEAAATLTAQRRMLAVELAGIEARIKFCEKMLNNLHAESARRDQIESAKVAAEIELNGQAAKQAEINRIIQGVHRLQDAKAVVSALPPRIARFKKTIEELSKAIEALKEYQLGYQPAPVEDGKVTIRRVKWTTPAKPESHG